MDYLTSNRCMECGNAKYKETFGEGNKLYFCAKHKAYITELTLTASILGCKGKDFQRRSNE